MSFPRYKEFRELQEQKHRAWLEYKKERDEKLARGEKVGPLERDPTAEVEIGLLGLIKFLSLTLLIIVLAGKFVTGSFLWDYDGKWVQLKTYIPVWCSCFLHERVEGSLVRVLDLSRSSKGCFRRICSLNMMVQIPTCPSSLRWVYFRSFLRSFFSSFRRLLLIIHI
jgi:hypothetical protein